MGKWAKGHLKPKNALNPLAGMKDLSRSLKDDIQPDMPDMSESSEQEALRNRQAEQLAKLDEDENRRLKALFRGRSGTRMFRGAGSSRSRSSSGSSGSGSSGAAGGSGAGSGGSFGGRGGGGGGSGLTP